MIKDILTRHYTNMDFPFYNDNPSIPIIGWITLFSSIIVGFAAYSFFSDYSEIVGGFVQLVIMAIPLLYYSKWNYSILIHKVDKNEFKLALIMFIGYILYVLILNSIFGSYFSIKSIAGGSLDSILSLIFTMMGEELIKFIPLMFLMGVFYKHSNNRTISFAMATAIVLFAFALLHDDGSVNILSLLTFQGLGSMFEVYGYIKTKNLMVPYISHLFTDVFLELITILLL